MRTKSSHDYHGITLRNDGYGWTIQIKLLGKYRQLRTYASTPELAARRHDIALSKLDAFVEPSALPNFPEDFEGLSISRDDVIDGGDGGSAFFDDLLSLFSALCKEADAVGLDPMDLSSHRKAAAQKKLDELNTKRKLARTKMSIGLLKFQMNLSSLGLSVEASRQLAEMLDKTKQLLDSAT